MALPLSPGCTARAPAITRPSGGIRCDLTKCESDVIDSVNKARIANRGLTSLHVAKQCRKHSAYISPFRALQAAIKSSAVKVFHLYSLISSVAAKSFIIMVHDP